MTIRATGYLVAPIAQVSALSGFQAAVDAVLGLPRCDCAGCSAAARLPCTGVGRCADCRSGPSGAVCRTYTSPSMDPMHGVAVTATYASVLTSADGTQCAYPYDATTAPIIDPQATMTPLASLPSGWSGAK